MRKEEIALRLVEAWGGQRGAPANFYSFLSNYEEALEFIEKLNKED